MTLLISWSRGEDGEIGVHGHADLGQWCGFLRRMKAQLILTDLILGSPEVPGWVAERARVAPLPPLLSPGVYVTGRLLYHLPRDLWAPAEEIVPVAHTTPDGQPPILRLPAGPLAAFLTELGDQSQSAQTVLKRLLSAPHDNPENPLPVRLANRLGNPGLGDLADALLMSDEDLLKVRGLGAETVRALARWVARRTKRLGMRLTLGQVRRLLRTLTESDEHSAVAPEKSHIEGGDCLSVRFGALPYFTHAFSTAILRGLTARTRSGLRKNGIENIGQLSRMRDGDLLGWQNFGEASLRNLKDSLGSLAGLLADIQLQECESEQALRRRIALRLPLIEQLQVEIDALEHREQQVVLLRPFALEDPLRLKDLAEQLGLSRERVRQIEHHALSQLDPDRALVKLANEKITGLRLGRTSPLTLEELESLDPWFRDASRERGLLAGLLDSSGGPNVVVSRVPGTPAFVTHRAARDPAALAESLRRRPSAPGVGPGELASELARSVSAPELGRLILTLAGDVVEGPDGPVFNPRMPERIEAVLDAAEGPLHVSEIERRLRQVGLHLTTHAVRGNLERARVVRTAPSTYTLAAKLREWDRYLPEVKVEVQDLMEAAPSRQWGVTEMISILTDEGVAWAPSMPAFVLDYLLRKLPQFERLGRGLWGLAAGGHETRLPVLDVACRILREEGRPIEYAELDRRVRQVRSVGYAIQISWPMVRLPESIVGLGPRDLLLSDEQFAMLQRKARNRLRGGGGRLDAAALSELLSRVRADGPPIDAGTIARILANDTGIAIDGDGEGVRLRDIPRRSPGGPVQHRAASGRKGSRTPAEHLREFLDGRPGPVPITEMADALGGRLGRSLPIGALRMQLRVAGWEEVGEGSWAPTEDSDAAGDGGRG